MTQHTELIERLRASSRWWFDRNVRNSVDADAIAALEAQAREIAELKAQEAELCTLYGLAQAECKKLRAEIEELRKNAERYAWLRHGDNDEKVLCNGPVAKDYWYLLRGEKLDAAIDAARKQGDKHDYQPKII